MSDTSAAKVGDVLVADAEVDLAALRPDDVDVEMVLTRRLPDGTLRDTTIVPLTLETRPLGPTRRYRGSHRMAASGTFASGMRVRARGADRPVRAFEDLFLWA